MSGKLDEQDLSELYELEVVNYSAKEVSKYRRKRYLMVPGAILLLIVLSQSVKSEVTLGDVLKIDDSKLNRESMDGEAIEGSVALSELSDGTVIKEGTVDIDSRLKNGELLSDIVKDYFKTEYGIEVAVVDNIDVVEPNDSKNIFKSLTVKDIDSGRVYEFKYFKDVNGTVVSDTYGSALTSKLLGVRLTEYYKDVLPEGSSLWVDSESLGSHPNVDNKDISNIIMNSDIEGLLAYCDSVNMFRGIGVNIVIDDSYLDSKYTIEDSIADYEKVLLDIATTFENKLNPNLTMEVCFFEGEQGKLNVMSYLEQKIGLNGVGGSFFIDWYKEIPLMGDDAKNNIIGAMSIKSNAVSVLNDYYIKNKSTYVSTNSENKTTYVPVYNTVEGIMEDSVAIEQRNIQRVRE